MHFISPLDKISPAEHQLLERETVLSAEMLEEGLHMDVR